MGILFVGWMVFLVWMMTALPPKSFDLILIVTFLPLVLGVAVYWLSAEKFGEFAMRRYERFAERLLGSRDGNRFRK